MTTASMSPLHDEAALRAAFDAEYGPLLQAARADLGEAKALAPRVVESAFVHAWLERDHITTPDQLHSMLVEDVHHGAARALSRRAAAHRFGGFHHPEAEAPRGAATDATRSDAADPEASWGRVLGAIHGHGSAAQSAAVAAARHEAASHVAQIAHPRSWKVPVLIGVIALAASLGIVALLDRLGESQAVLRAVNAPDARQIAASTGQMASVTLDDGTRARLAADSRLSVPLSFGDDLRAVRLEGAASFDVPSRGDDQFQVFARDAVITATGTAFSVRAWPEDESMIVSVREGTVTVAVGEVSRELKAGASLVIGDGGAWRAPTALELEEAMSWQENRLVIAQRPLRRALPQLRRWYGTDIKVVDPKLLDRPVSVRTTTEATNEAIAQVEQSGKLRFENTGEMLLFKDGADTAKTAPASKRGR